MSDQEYDYESSSEYDSDEDPNHFKPDYDEQNEFVDDDDEEYSDDDQDEDRRRRKPHRHGKSKDDTRTAILEGRAKRAETLRHGPEVGVTITGSTYRPKVSVSDEVFGPPLNSTTEIPLMDFAKKLEEFYKFRGCYREVLGAEVK